MLKRRRPPREIAVLPAGERVKTQPGRVELEASAELHRAKLARCHVTVMGTTGEPGRERSGSKTASEKTPSARMASLADSSLAVE